MLRKKFHKKMVPAQQKSYEAIRNSLYVLNRDTLEAAAKWSNSC